MEEIKTLLSDTTLGVNLSFLLESAIHKPEHNELLSVQDHTILSFSQSIFNKKREEKEALIETIYANSERVLMSHEDERGKGLTIASAKMENEVIAIAVLSKRKDKPSLEAIKAVLFPVHNGNQIHRRHQRLWG